MKITTELVRSLREKAGSGLKETHEALVLADGDIYLDQGILHYTGMAINIRGRSKEEWVMERAQAMAEELRAV